MVSITQLSRRSETYRLDDRVAIVTGAGSSGKGVGTGKAIAIEFARAGALVALVDADIRRAQETLSAIRSEGGIATVVSADVSAETDCRRAIEHVVSKWGRVNILVNNVGTVTAGDALIHEAEAEAWSKQLAVNLMGVVFMSKYAIREMLTGAGGTIVNISSVAGLRAQGWPSYGAAKAAIVQLTRDIALMYGSHGIRCNAIAPGHIFTPMAGGESLSQDLRDARKNAAPLRIEGNAWDVASAALYLSCDASRFVTAQCLAVDGGASETLPIALRGD